MLRALRTAPTTTRTRGAPRATPLRSPVREGLVDPIVRRAVSQDLSSCRELHQLEMYPPNLRVPLGSPIHTRDDPETLETRRLPRREFRAFAEIRLDFQFRRMQRRVVRAATRRPADLPK